MFGRKKAEIKRLKWELMMEMKARLRAEKKLEELENRRKEDMRDLSEAWEALKKERAVLEEKRRTVDQFYNLLIFDGTPQAKGADDGD